jgi:Cullin protein neddylation domain
VEQLRKMFQPDPRMIKKQVESLIDREYLERDTVSAASSLGRCHILPLSELAEKFTLLLLLCGATMAGAE